MVSAFSIPQAKRDERVPENPGPGSYNHENSPKVTKPADPRYSIGHDKRDSHLKSEVPGPGSYNSHEIKAHLQKEPSYSFRLKGKDYQEQNPLGPGSYNGQYEVEKQKAPAYSMRPRAKSSMDNQVPGPGNYEPFRSSVVLEHAPKFGHDKRDGDVGSPVPGPGSYNYENAFNRYASRVEPSYGIGSRLPDSKGMQVTEQRRNVPGPGSYDNSKNGFSRIGGIMSRDLRLSAEKSEVPGPGTYNGKEGVVKSQNPSFSLPKSSRDLKVYSEAPGPGNYESPESFRKVAEKSPNWKFGSDKRLVNPETYVPGPGNYNPHDISTRKGAYIGVKTKDNDGLNVPGPGAYEPTLEYKGNKSQLYSIGKSSRDLKLNSEAPGPGAYNGQQINSRRNIRFAHDSRLKEFKDGVPGPGQYDIKPMFADVPKYLLPNKN